MEHTSLRSYRVMDRDTALQPSLIVVEKPDERRKIGFAISFVDIHLIGNVDDILNVIAGDSFGFF